jgi:hypothetical protein
MARRAGSIDQTLQKIQRFAAHWRKPNILKSWSRARRTRGIFGIFGEQFEVVNLPFTGKGLPEVAARIQSSLNVAKTGSVFRQGTQALPGYFSAMPRSTLPVLWMGIPDRNWNNRYQISGRGRLVRRNALGF